MSSMSWAHRVTVEALGLEAHEPVEGTVLLELASVSGADPVQLRGEVRHVAQMTGGGLHVGIRFIALSARAEQLLDLLFALPRRLLSAASTERSRANSARSSRLSRERRSSPEGQVFRGALRKSRHLCVALVLLVRRVHHATTFLLKRTGSWPRGLVTPFSSGLTRSRERARGAGSASSSTMRCLPGSVVRSWKGLILRSHATRQLTSLFRLGTSGG